MEGYVDLHTLKALNYLVAVISLISLIFFWQVLKAPAVRRAVQRVGASIADMARWFFFPEHYYFHPGHTWACPGDDGRMLVGVDDFATKLVGQIDEIELPKPGTRVRQGQVVWKVRVAGKTFSMRSPVEGVVEEIHEAVRENPSLLLQDPYKNGWILRIRPEDPAASLSTLLSGGLARRCLETDLSRLLPAGSGELGVLAQDGGLLLQDGGMPIHGIAQALEPERWDELVSEMFLTKE